ncbi:MAG: TolC family protein [Candidatus Omnitrophota bacterium]|nr:TolC family protein [Candidatus Omnitrophota bacterium]
MSPAVTAGVSREEKRELKATHKAYQDTAVDELTEAMSLDEALRYGSLKNASLRAAFYRWKASVHDVKQSTSLEDPQVSFKLGIEHVETRLGPQEDAYSVSQHLPFPGKLYIQGKEAVAMSRQKYAEYQMIKLQYFYELKDAYYEYWFLYKNILVTEKNSEFLKRFEGVAQSQFKSGIASNQDLLKAQVELGKLENDILTLNDYRKPITARLNAVLNRDVEMSIGWPEEIDHEVKPLDERLVYEKFHGNNPDLEGAAQRIEETKKKVWLARLDYLPDVNVSFDYISIGNGPVNVPDNGRDAASVMFKVNVPLWYGKQKSQVDEAKALRESAESEHEQLENNLSAKIKMVYFQIENAERQINLYRNALIPKAEQSLNASETAYSGGRVDFLNLIDSQRTLLNFQLSYYKAIRDYEQRLAELEMMVGESLRG